MPVVVDDRLLLDALAGGAPDGVAEELANGGLFTTAAWYYRLGRAVFAGRSDGALSGRLASLPPEVRTSVRDSLLAPPEAVGLLHPRAVVPIMITLRGRRQLNVLSAEALATALLVSASLIVTTDSPLLRSAAHEAGVDYRIA